MPGFPDAIILNLRSQRAFCLLLSALFLSCGPSIGSRVCGEDRFESHIAPLLISRCLECHHGTEPSGGLDLSSHDGMQGDSGPAVAPGRPDESLLIERIEAGEMPPPDRAHVPPLTAREVETLRRWIAAGAKWPERRRLDIYEMTNDARAGRDWWSLQPIRSVTPPVDEHGRADINPIDAFVRRRLTEAGLSPAPPAHRRTLIRRIHLDLLGLPPTFAQVQEFVADDRPDAWERLVDQLLASPQFGERWARHWLDVARYADTSGYERDQEKLYSWRYRDWVVRAINDDLPYDQFVMRQLAGDEINRATESTVIATGFLRLGTWNDEPNDPQDYQYDRLEDLVHATSSAFLGMTVKCARCHDHKFDPIMQRDYYRFASAFWPGPIAARDRAWLGGPTADELGFDNVLGWTDLGPAPRPLHLLKNGEREHPLDEVVAGTPSFVPALRRDFDRPPADVKTTLRRRRLAEWIVDPEQPLTARVMVNRLWLHHMGRGLVGTPNNFGFRGQAPTHPDLLEWLAKELIDHGWQLKRIHRMILLSQTYRQSVEHPAFDKHQQRDGSNRLWWRAERRRLDAESLRDAMLAVSGYIDLRMGGRGFHPTIQPQALEGLSRKAAAWTASPDREQQRRSLYIFAQRSLLPPLLTTFDFTDTTLPCAQRNQTTVPTQALAMLNHQFVHDQSSRLAVELARQESSHRSIVRQLWHRILQREPTSDEMALALDHLESQQARFEEVARVGESAATLTPRDGAIASLAHVLLNSNEFLYLD